MFDDRAKRFPRSPDGDFADFIVRFLQDAKDPVGILRHLDDVVRENKYTCPEFDDMVDDVFDAAEFVFRTNENLRDVGEATLAVVISYARWMVMRDNPRWLDDLGARDFREIEDSARNFEDILREIKRGSRGGRDDRGRRDDRDDRGRGRGRRDDRDRDDRDRGRRGFRSDGSLHPDDVREERQREARRTRDNRERERDREPRRDERSTREERAPRAAEKVVRTKSRIKGMSEGERKRLMGTWKLNLFQARVKSGTPQTPDYHTAELEALGIPVDDFVELGGALMDSAPKTAPEVRKTAEREVPTSDRRFQRTEPERPQTQSSERELVRGAKRIPEPAAFEEVFEERDHATTRPSPREPMTAAEEAVLMPSIDSHIDYNAALTSNAVTYASNADRPVADPLVPTLEQWARADFPVDKREFIEELPSLPPIRGFAEHLPALYDPNKWVPYIRPTADGYKMLDFREFNVNKDEIMIPNLGNTRRTQRIANSFPAATEKSTRFNALSVSTEAQAAVMRHDEATRQWVEAGSNPADTPVPEAVDTARHGQMVNIPFTIHATSVQDSVVKMHAALAKLGVGLDETANIAANVEVHRLVGIVPGDDDWAIAKKHLEMFELDGAGAHLMLPHLWQAFVASRSNLPEAIWLKLNLYYTDVINEILANNLAVPHRIESFEADGRQLLETLSANHGRYMAEVISIRCKEVSERLRCLSFKTDENIGSIEQGIWIVERHRVVYANTMLNELGLAVFDYGERDATPDRNRVSHYVIRPEQNESLVSIVERLTLDANGEKGDAVVDIVTLDDYSAALHQNWLSQGACLTLALTHL